MSGERTEAATPRRLKQLRSEGRVTRSLDLSTALGLLGGFFVLQQFGGDGVGRLRWFMEQQLVELAHGELTGARLGDLALTSRDLFFAVTAPVLATLTVIGVVSNLGQVGFLVSSRAVTPSFDRINPLANLGRLFSTRALIELAKTLFKVGVVAYVVARTYTDSLPTLLALGTTDLQASLRLLAETTLHLGLISGVMLLALGVLDYGYQRWEFQRSARMTKDELKQELRQSDGSPQLRAHIRQRQRKLASGRMMHEVPKADVVLTNPTHLAVALAYRSDEMGAPQVVAKGAGQVAERIKALAREHAVPVVENKPLARLLYGQVEVGQEVPVTLYQAVAEVLAHIYSLRRRAAVKEVDDGPSA